MIPTYNTTRTVCQVVAVLCCGAAAGSVQEFLTASRPWLPDGPIIMAREAVGEAIGLNYAGYDPATGAWFMAGSTRGGGRDPSGQAYFIKAGENEVVTPVHEPLPYHIGTLLPVAIVAAMHERPDIITDAIQKDGSWFVTYRVTMDQTKSPPKTRLFVAQFDAASGRLRSQEQGDGEDRYVIEFDLSNPQLEKRRDRDDGPQHKVSLEPDAASDSFTQDAIRARMRAADIAVQQKSAAVLAGYTEDNEGNWTPPSGGAATVPYAAGAIRKYRLPLLIGGGLVIAIAGFEVYRRRSA